MDLPKNEKEFWQFLLDYAERLCFGPYTVLLLKALYAMSRVNKPPDEEFVKLEEEIQRNLMRDEIVPEQLHWNRALDACWVSKTVRRRAVWIQEMIEDGAKQRGIIDLDCLKNPSIGFSTEEEVDHFIAWMEEKLGWSGLKLEDIVKKGELELLRSEAKKRTRDRLSKV